MEVTFYSLTPGLVCYAGKTTMQNVEGTMRAVDPPTVRFQPVAKSPTGKPFGIFKTDDPVVIDYLKNRMEVNADVISEEQFSKLMIPAETRATDLAEKVRLLEEENRLLKQVKAQEAAAVKTLPKPRQE